MDLAAELTPFERPPVLQEFNDTAAAYSQSVFAHQLFEEQVRHVPDAVALISSDKSLTYRQLNTRANQLASYLRTLDIGPDQMVGICMDRGLDMVVAILAVLKAGGSYVPLDPQYPLQRRAFILNDANPKVVLTQERFLTQMPRILAHTIALDSHWEAISRHEDRDLSPGEIGLSCRHLAYVIYTSGSTGSPKGVMVEHRGLSNYLQWALHEYRPELGDAVIVSSPLAFDATITSLYCPLLSGRSVVLLPDGRELEDLETRLLQPTRWSLVKISPAHLQVLGERLKSRQPPSTVRAFVIGGEALSPATVTLWQSLWPHTRLINEYGPTETVVGCSIYEVSPGWSATDAVPIGRPIANTQLYVLDEYQRPVPIGVCGEIYIGGAGVARGYLNRPELTAERFIPVPFSADPNARLYRSGDLGRWRIDGALEYLGRNDQQVKIRGFRIELGEIQAQLQTHERVKDAAVLAREDIPGEKRLVGYITVDRAAPLEGGLALKLREYLLSRLPSYMVPSAFVVMQALPLTRNGKVDWRALPAPTIEAYVTRDYLAPHGEKEVVLADVWQAVLQIEKVGRQDHFFELGGHSLLLIRVLERLRERGFWIEFSSAFANPTLSALAAMLHRDARDAVPIPPNLVPPNCHHLTPEMFPGLNLTQVELDLVIQSVPGGAANIQDIYPLSALQEGLLFHHLMDQRRGDTYVLRMLLSVPSRQKVGEFVLALEHIIGRHDALRTAFLWDGLSRPLQVVYRHATLVVEETASSTRSYFEKQMQLRLQTMDLSRAPLLHLQIAPDRDDHRWLVLLRTHHLICDNESLELLMSEVSAFLAGLETMLPPPVPYRHHVFESLALAQRQDSEAFFRKKLQNVDESTAPFGLIDVHTEARSVEEFQLNLQPSLEREVRRQARSLGVSPATVFHAAWALVIARTCGRDDVVFGTVLLGRMLGTAGTQRALGMFINTLPLRLNLRRLTARGLIAQTQREIVDLLGQEQASLSLAQRCSDISGSAPLFTALLNYRHHLTESSLGLSPTAAARALCLKDSTNYPIVMSVDDYPGRFTLTAQTDHRVNPQRIVGYLATAVHFLVDILQNAPDTAALSIAVLPPSEHEQVIRQFNKTDRDYPATRRVNELFEEQVARTPDAIALSDEDEAITYAQINTRANQLSHYLTQLGVRMEEPIPVLIPRCAQMVVAQLAVLKSGAVYVPIDPSLPAERQAFMIRDCLAQRVIACHGERLMLAPPSLQWIDCDAIAIKVGTLSTQNSPSVSYLRSSAHLAAAYVMYTSGSTGTPKGVVVSHAAINRLVINTDYIQIQPDDRLAHSSNPAFDASTFEIWGALLNGAKVVVFPYSLVLDPERFARALLRERVSIVFLTVGLFTQYVNTLAPVFCHLKYVLTGGDVVDPEIVRKVLRESPPGQLLNAYGPTEGTTFSTIYRIAALEPKASLLPIGRPIANTRVYLLNSYLQPVPVGAPGEIYIAGAGIALGYLNRAMLTAQRFVPDPFSPDPPARLYKSGDIGRWTDDGCIEFLGRNDRQVKLRGFRIELGEIETRLTSHPHVKEAVVIDTNTDILGKHLIAYVVSNAAGDAFDFNQLRAYLEKSLPDYMVPSAFVSLQRLPLTPNGKLDRKALPPPDRGDYVAIRYEAPQGEVEELLANIWREVLQIEKVGREDSFFALGGHSLLATQVLTRVRASITVECSMRLLFEYPTLRRMAAEVESLRNADLVADIVNDGGEMGDLLEEVASMSDSAVQELVRRLSMRGMS